MFFIRKTGLFVCLAVMAALLACSNDTGARDPASGGVQYTGKVRFDGRNHRYFLYAPNPAVLKSSMPLVIGLHGGGSSVADFEIFTQLRQSAEKYGFALLLPEGFKRTWNAGSCCAPATREGINHVQVIRAMVHAVEKRLEIDSGRVYATGYSNGGMMAYRLACQASDIITAIAPVAAYQMDQNLNGAVPRTVYNCQPQRPVPVLHLHGLQDQCAPFAGSPSAGPEGGVRPPVEESIGFWRQQNGCAATSRSDNYGDTAHCQVWDNCTAGSEVQLCTVDNGGHIWPGTGKNPLRPICGGQPSTAMDANDVMWAFFQRFRI